MKKNRKQSKQGFAVSSQAKARLPIQTTRKQGVPPEIMAAFKAYASDQCNESIKLCKVFLETYPNNAFVLGLLASNYKKLGDNETAFTYFEKSLSISQDNADILHNFAGLLLDRCDLQGALKASTKANSISKTNSNHWLRYASILQTLGNREEAIKVCDRIIQASPEVHQAWINKLGSYKQGHNLKQILDFAQEVYRRFPNNPDVLQEYATVLFDYGKISEAKAIVAKLPVESENNLAFTLFRARLAETSGDLPLAKKLVLQCFSDATTPVQKLYSLIKLSDFAKVPDEYQKLISQFEELLPALKNSNSALVDIHYALSKMYHQNKDYASSARSLKIASSLKYSDLEINRSFQFLLNSVDAVDCSSISYARPASIGNCEHIFIIGLPRCGSTLTESILSMKNDSIDLGEISALRQTLELHQQNGLADDQFQNSYRQLLKTTYGIDNESKITIDKNLANFRHCLPIIQLMPNARVIYCTRNPLDHILSNQKANFSYGNIYTYCPVRTAKALCSLEQKMQEVDRAMPGLIYHLDYDRLVSNPEVEIRVLIDFMGWDWSDDYLYPEQSKRTVKTASIQQVRKPINAKSLGGWKKYSQLLAPAIEVVESSGIYSRYNFSLE